MKRTRRAPELPELEDATTRHLGGRLTLGSNPRRRAPVLSGMDSRARRRSGAHTSLRVDGRAPTDERATARTTAHRHPKQDPARSGLISKASQRCH